VEAAIIPILGMVAAFGLSGTNCLVAHVSTPISCHKNRRFRIEINPGTPILSQAPIFDC